MSFTEQAVTTVVPEPPAQASVIQSFERMRSRERNRNINQQRADYNTQLAVPYYTTQISASQLSASYTTTVTPIPPSPPTPPAANKLSIQTGKLLVGTKPVALPAAVQNIRRVTILAASSNAGTIWVNTNPNIPAGFGFPLVAGAAKDYGHPAMSDKTLDPTQIVLIGTDVNDTVYISYEF
jgi:hypothetical protein